MHPPEFWNTDGVTPALLSPLGALYGWSVRVRQARAHPFRPKACVVCVGNLTAGGTGKTPVAIALAHALAARGLKTAFLSRGYGGRCAGPLQIDPAHHAAHDVGDEPLLLAAHGLTIVSRDRARGAKLADFLGADIIVMDDGFQNFQIAKDISLVVVDAATGFGNGRLIPAGPLREPVAQGLARADCLVLMGDGAPALPAFAGAILHAHIVPSAPDALSGRSVFAFAGIGRPQKFFDMLRALDARVLATQSFPDHHRFNATELTALKQAAQKTEALLVTTEKDFVRLDPITRSDVVPVPVHAAFMGDAPFHALLDRIAEAGKVSRA
ncbi:MAG TPA: tetraacyldisaccharide 4'-kinase [Micropepsaceae bacterium]|nr:tetraacyldisaccharide 4'-kinase [Micropepsaceae bacterium]